MEVVKQIDSTLKPEPAVSVVIPTFNRAHLLKRAIVSVLAQTLSNFELIIVDDGSTDNTADVIKEFADSRIRFIPLDKNCGGSYARNQGIQAARAEFVSFLDSDDEWLPEKLELQLARLQACEDNNVSVVYCQGYEYYESEERKKLPNLAAYEGDVFDHLLRGWLPPTTSLFLVRRTSLIQVGGFDVSLPSYQDYDLWLRLAEAKNHFAVVDKALIIRYFHGQQIGGNLSANLAGFQAFKNKWGPVIKQRLGSRAYRKSIGVKASLIRMIQVGKAVNNGQKIIALGHSLFLIKLLPWSGPYVIAGLVLTFFGHSGLKTVVKIKDVLLQRQRVEEI